MWERKNLSFYRRLSNWVGLPQKSGKNSWLHCDWMGFQLQIFHWSPLWPTETKREQKSHHLRACLISLRFLWQETGCVYFFMHWGLKIHSPTKISAGHPQRQINTSAWVRPPLFLIFSSLLPVIPLPHLSCSPLFAGDTPATPLAERLAKKYAGLHRLPHSLLTSHSQRWCHKILFSCTLGDTSKL